MIIIHVPIANDLIPREARDQVICYGDVNSYELSKQGITHSIRLNKPFLLSVLLDPETLKFAKFSQNWLDTLVAYRQAHDVIESSAKLNKYKVKQMVIAKDHDFKNLNELINAECFNPKEIYYMDLTGCISKKKNDYENLVSKFPFISCLYIDDRILI